MIQQFFITILWFSFKSFLETKRMHHLDAKNCIQDPKSPTLTVALQLHTIQCFELFWEHHIMFCFINDKNRNCQSNDLPFWIWLHVFIPNASIPIVTIPNRRHPDRDTSTPSPPIRCIPDRPPWGERPLHYHDVNLSG